VRYEKGQGTSRLGHPGRRASAPTELLASAVLDAQFNDPASSIRAPEYGHRSGEGRDVDGSVPPGVSNVTTQGGLHMADLTESTTDIPMESPLARG